MRATHQAVLYPSLICADVPLVAAGWAIALSIDFHEAESIAATLLNPKIGLLFFGVWAVYLTDRILDSLRIGPQPDSPIRYQFSAEHPRLLISLITISSLGSVLCLLLIDDASFVLMGSGIALITILYFVCFRTNRLIRSTGVPIKELAISLCFTGGILLCSEPPGWNLSLAMLSVGMTTLFLLNCLSISAAESDFDRIHDPQAFFSSKANSRQWLNALSIVSVAISVGLMSKHGYSISSVSLLVAGLLTWSSFRFRRLLRLPVQTVMDGVLCFPWLLIIWATIP